MIRICVVAPVHMTGGQAIEARTLVRGLEGDPRFQMDVQPIDLEIPAWIASLRGVRTLVRWPLYLAGLIRRVRRADVVHIFTAAFSPFVIFTTPAIFIARWLDTPVLVNYRDGRAPDHLPSRWVRWVLRKSSLLVFPSGFLRDVFARFGLRGEVVSNVVDMERFRFRERSPLRPVLISARLLEELYAVENTVRAFAMVRERFPDARLIVIGDGDRAPSLKQLVRREGIGGVEFHGSVPHDEVPDWFDRADVFVNSSREDNMPHSILEAFSAGLPVVTTPAGGIPYVVEDGRNGLFADIDDPRSMADAVIRLLEDPDLASRLVEAARRDCVARYSWQAARERWVELYGRLSGRDRTPREAQARAGVA